MRKLALLTLLLVNYALGGIKPEHQPLIEQLLELRDPAEFDLACNAAAKAGVPHQAILEARFLYLVDAGQFTQLAAFSEELAAHEKNYRIEDSIIFAVREDFSAIVQYTYALRALQRGEEDAFKTHIKEAFWLSPKQSSVFAKHIEDFRLQKRMAQITLNLKRKYPRQLEPQKSTSLAQLIEEKPALLLQFWSPWSPQVEASLTDFKITVAELKKNNIPTASILIETNEQTKTDADTFVKTNTPKLPITWLLDHKKNSLTTTLRIQNIPTFVLVSQDGKILFNGSPAEKKFWDELQKIAPNLKRPSSTE